ncbi:MAG: hypothetical protein U0790_14915 [Isosphaeraceae bacterium]
MPEGAVRRPGWPRRTVKDLKALTHPLDPLTHARGLIGKRVSMIAGRVDEVVLPGLHRGPLGRRRPAPDPLA